MESVNALSGALNLRGARLFTRRVHAAGHVARACHQLACAWSRDTCGDTAAEYYEGSRRGFQSFLRGELGT